ncbi:PTS mannose/fructose/sorbose/N-acetylgalactosamine transporter subunit IIC [Companilactobacillus muriivasis]|uniref:PTS mannose/fructose/sorbose/N-acetylgalactosamine transporter subunit IIC n=1 Tax=Companilactobacillus muriivasis TaxID=3081444 RepID=UPI0030C6EBE4
MSTLMIATLGALSYFICFGGNWILGVSMIERPLIVGTVTGLLLGNVSQGIIIGASLEAIFMGAVNIGGAVSAEPAAATVFAVVFSLTTGGVTPKAALAIAVPIGVLAGIMTMFVNNVVLSFLVPFMDRYAAEDNGKGIIRLHFGAWFFRFFLFALVVFFGILVGRSSVQAFVNNIPAVIMTGLTTMSGFLPAVGFAILLKMLWSKELAVYYFLGFILVSYLKLPLVAVAAIGAILVVISTTTDWKILQLEKRKPEVVNASEDVSDSNGNNDAESDEEEDFFK